MKLDKEMLERYSVNAIENKEWAVLTRYYMLHAKNSRQMGYPWRLIETYAPILNEFERLCLREEILRNMRLGIDIEAEEDWLLFADYLKEGNTFWFTINNDENLLFRGFWHDNKCYPSQYYESCPFLRIYADEDKCHINMYEGNGEEKSFLDYDIPIEYFKAEREDPEEYERTLSTKDYQYVFQKNTGDHLYYNCYRFSMDYIPSEYFDYINRKVRTKDGSFHGTFKGFWYDAQKLYMRIEQEDRFKNAWMVECNEANQLELDEKETEKTIYSKEAMSENDITKYELIERLLESGAITKQQARILRQEKRVPQFPLAENPYEKKEEPITYKDSGEGKPYDVRFMNDERNRLDYYKKFGFYPSTTNGRYQDFAYTNEYIR